MQRKEEYLKAMSLQYDLLESFESLGEFMKELAEVKKEIREIRKNPERVFLRADAVETMYGIKRSSLELYVSEGILTKYKIKGLALYKREEIESKIVAVAS